MTIDPSDDDPAGTRFAVSPLSETSAAEQAAHPAAGLREIAAELREAYERLIAHGPAGPGRR